MSNKPKVSIIVTTKNEENSLEQCLRSIVSQTYKNIELILVDNNSEDNTKEIAEKYTRLVFIKGPERSAQRNYGAKKAKGDYYLFLDADMRLTPRVVEECVKIVQSSVVGGVVIPEKSEGVGYWGKCKALERVCYLGESSLEAARFFDKNVFWEMLGYDENMTGPEDWDLPQRIRKKYKTGRIKSKIIHDEGNVTLWGLMKKKYYYAGEASLYLKKHPFRTTVTQIFYLLRPAFYKNWKKIIKNPFIGCGMIIMLIAEQMSGLVGFILSTFNSKSRL